MSNVRDPKVPDNRYRPVYRRPDWWTKRWAAFPFFALGLAGLVSCNNQQQATSGDIEQTAPASPPQTIGRWYSQAQVTRGYALFQEYCATCHKPDASGTENWRQRDSDGKLPPPPLNGTAHTWHHPLSVLRRTIRIGGAPLGGSMPAFDQKLTGSEIDDVLAWVQSLWSDETYQIWHHRNIQADNRLRPLKKG